MDKVTKTRIVALDVLRGLAVAGMILVVSPGSWTNSYRQLQHAPWNGFTAADMVFPTFLLATGFALGLSFPKARYLPGHRTAVWIRIARRVFALILLGLVLNALPFFDLAQLRIPGILQRIALCYALAAALCLLTARHAPDGVVHLRMPIIAAAAMAILFLYWLVLVTVPVPGIGAGRLDAAGNLPGYIDRLVFTVPHLWPYGLDAAGKVTYDPEGLLSTLPATVNVLAGVLAAWWWKRRPDRAAMVFVTAGIALIVIALVCDQWMPINKRIWTSSFALLSSGVSLSLLGLLVMALDGSPTSRIAYPLRVLGGNAILAFTVSQILSAIGGVKLIAGRTPQDQGYALALRIVPDDYFASLLCAIAILAMIILAITPLHRRAIHFQL
ncbi:putative acyltransferase [Sphingomonas sp. UYAg733]